MPEPLYTAANCRVAYQLHWSLTLFATQAWPGKDSWCQTLQQTAEVDGVRPLDFHLTEPTTGQLFVSSKPDASPAQIVRSVKGRLQYIVRDAIPQLWRRHYSLTSVGDASNDVLQGYVGRQVEHHPMADPRTTERLLQAQFHDPAVDLAALRASNHGRFTHSLQLVLENEGHLADTREEVLAASSAMAIGVCRKRSLPQEGLAAIALGDRGESSAYPAWLRRDRRAARCSTELDEQPGVRSGNEANLHARLLCGHVRLLRSRRDSTDTGKG
jgi:hypothetical protein